MDGEGHLIIPYTLDQNDMKFCVVKKEKILNYSLLVLDILMHSMSISRTLSILYTKKAKKGIQKWCRSDFTVDWLENREGLLRWPNSWSILKDFRTFGLQREKKLQIIGEEFILIRNKVVFALQYINCPLDFKVHVEIEIQWFHDFSRNGWDT